MREEQSEERFIALEEKVAYLENVIATLGEELDTVCARLDKCERQIRILAAREKEAPAVCALSEEVPPPHY